MGGNGNKRGPARVGLVLGVLVVAGALVVFTWPRLQAGIHYLPVDTAVKRYFRSGELPSAQLDALATRAREAIALHPHYRYWDGLSFVNYLQAVDPITPPWLRRPALHRSMIAGLEAVRRAPAKPRTWLRIAQARAALGTDETAIAGALKMSILTGRVEPTLLLPRLELGYAHLDLLDDETVALLRDQTLLGWRVNERGFRRAVREGRLDVSRLESVLGENGKVILAALERST